MGSTATCCITLLAFYTLASISDVLGFDQSDKCSIYQNLTGNDLSETSFDLLDPETKKICVTGRFALAIEIEEAHVVLGYIGMDDIAVEGNCNSQRVARSEQPVVVKPEGSNTSIKPPISAGNQDSSLPSNSDEPQGQYLKLTARFPCGVFNFTFVKDTARNVIYVSSISGTIRYIEKSALFQSPRDKVYFKTSDLKHHYKQTDSRIEIVSEHSSDVRLKAHFYHVEFEVFRNATSKKFETEPDPSPVSSSSFLAEC